MALSAKRINSYTKPKRLYDLSIIIPGIRTYNWQVLYDSVKDSFSGDWEMVFVGPKPSEGLKHYGNIRFIQDYGTPIRCQQIGLIKSSGKYITWGADDGVFLPNALNESVDYLNKNEDHIVSGKYFEGDTPENVMMDNNYYFMNTHAATRSQFAKNHYLILNIGVLKRQTLINFGGWDCSFEVCPMSHTDLGFRLQNAGITTILQNTPVLRCSQMTNTTGDHAPIHYAQTKHDQPLYRKMYNDPQIVNRMVIDINNWKNSPEVWERRFNKDNLV